MLLNGGVTAIPMDSQRACVDAKFKVEASWTGPVFSGRAVCISQE